MFSSRSELFHVAFCSIVILSKGTKFLDVEVNWRGAVPEASLEAAHGVLAGLDLSNQAPQRRFTFRFEHAFFFYLTKNCWKK